MKIDNKYMNYKLCYVDGGEYYADTLTLYFTELEDIKKQWGDDWGDRPYEHNAGRPYTSDYDKPEIKVENGRGIYPKIDVYEIILTNTYDITTPCTNTRNSPYSVEDINNGVVPWLTIRLADDNVIYIKAGTTLKDTLNALSKLNYRVDVYGKIDEY